MHPACWTRFAPQSECLTSRHLTWRGKLVAYGELMLGIALIFGAFLGIAAFFGAFLLILAWRVAGYYGPDRDLCVCFLFKV
jgi:uncharacterized membrane protein YphA (DoxX/SURF4 family)